jgi:competence protein ComEA
MRTTSVQPENVRMSGAPLIAAAALMFASLCVAAAEGAASAPPGHAPVPMSKKAAPAVPVKRVDINSASRKELKTLPGIGDAEADKIIANRPYLTKTELVEKKVLGIGPFLSLKNRVIAVPKALPKAKPKGKG